jgi:cytosine/adenosine deaminase-related metal-dependent hydrolase
MIKYYSADYILPVSSDPIKNGIVAVTGTGEIARVYDGDNHDLQGKNVEYRKGIIVPGFVNSHCHLELSHLRGKIEKSQGLIAFIKQVLAKRADSEKAIEQAAREADEEMFKNGIIAVGDICNNNSSLPVKKKSKIHYHSYIELLGFNPDKAKEIFESGLELEEKLDTLKSSIVPHAAYSVSKELLRLISSSSSENKNLLTVHNQETEEENKFFRYKTGQFVEFYKNIGVNIDYFKPQARNSIQSILPLLPANQSIMLVHNIYTSLKDIYFIRRFGRDVTWCFCPNANLYIEDRLPKVEMFLFGDFNITLGTDSLASNDGLCMLSELKTLAKFCPSIPLTKTLAWATLNGAKFLRIDDLFGSIEKGKKPGLNLINNMDGLKLTSESTVTKLI